MSGPTVTGVVAVKRLEPGDRIGDRLVVRRVLGRGASATVYEAEHRELGSILAVKVVHADATREPHHLARFRREARICGRIRSAHVPQVYDVGRLDDGSPYLVMELLDGATLEERITRGPLPMQLVFDVGRQLLRALEAVHAQGAIHRDVKPENVVLLGEDDSRLVVKLVDFGISKSLDAPRFTIEGMVLGTPHYMAPEQVSGLDLDPRVDIYAAGAVLYEALTGRTPFQGRNADEVMTAVQRDPVIPPAVFRDDCHPQLDLLVMRALARDRHDRFASAHAMREALEEAWHAWERESAPVPLVAPRRRAVVPEPPRTPPLVHGVTERESDAPERESVRWMVAGAATAVVLAGLALAGVIAEVDPTDDAVAAPAPRTEETGPAPSPAAPDPEPEDAADPVAAQASGEPQREPEVQAEQEPRTETPAAKPEAREAASASPAARSPERRPARAGRAMRGPPSTTVLPARADPDELREQLRERVREAMLRDWPPATSADAPPSEPAKPEEPVVERDALPPILRRNPYDDERGVVPGDAVGAEP